MQIMKKLEERIPEIDGIQLTPEDAEREILRWLEAGKAKTQERTAVSAGDADCGDLRA